MLCATDDRVRDDDPWLETEPNHIHAGSCVSYLDAIRFEGARARSLYDLLLVPGLELTYFHPDPRHAAQAVAVEAASAPRGTGRFAEDWQDLAGAVDRFELFNRHDSFGWVAAKRLPFVASGDFHRHEHLATWKILIPCEKEERALIEYLQSGAPVHVTRLEPDHAASALAA